MPSYLLIDVGGGRDEIEADSDEHARAQAQEILHGAAADYFACGDNHRSTIWLDCDVVRKPTAEEDSEEWDEQLNAGFVCSLAIDVDPPKPSCPPASAQAPQLSDRHATGKDS
ncbi:MAG: hypothetical protein ACLP0J_09475 [Solirubrobacteraceae bacterium]|jgi:hypothetical protein